VQTYEKIALAILVKYRSIDTRILHENEIAEVKQNSAYTVESSQIDR
jgi:hypothetical protein